MNQVGLWLIIVVVYFLPALIAVARRHPDSLAISVLDALTAMTGVGWCVALFWALDIGRQQQGRALQH